jgi:hypothetical protein
MGGIRTTTHRDAWNKGTLVGHKAPMAPRKGAISSNYYATPGDAPLAPLHPRWASRVVTCSPIDPRVAFDVPQRAGSRR